MFNRFWMMDGNSQCVENEVQCIALLVAMTIFTCNCCLKKPRARVRWLSYQLQDLKKLFPIAVKKNRIRLLFFRSLVDHGFKHIGGDGFWPFQGIAQGPVPYNVGTYPYCPSDAKQHGIKVIFPHSIMPLNDS
jgi:hypothetical protein